MYVNLYCNHCDNIDCELRKLGSANPIEWLIGCTRDLSEDDYIEFEHIYHEIIPFIGMGQYKDEYVNIDAFNKKLFNSKIGTLLDVNGKADNRKRKVIDKLNSNMI